MPIASTMAYIKSILDGQKVPGTSDMLEAYVAPPDPETNQKHPHAYVWSSRGGEERNSGPRGPANANSMARYTPNLPAGWKMLSHSLEIWLTWFNDNTDPQRDSAFPFVIDLVMNALRTTPNPAEITDPGTGQRTQLVNLGTRMNWEYVPVKDTASQRRQRFDALVTAPVEEWIQA